MYGLLTAAKIPQITHKAKNKGEINIPALAFALWVSDGWRWAIGG
jgi:hypothetical protein